MKERFSDIISFDFAHNFILLFTSTEEHLAILKRHTSYTPTHSMDIQAIHTEAFANAGPAPVWFHGKITREQAEEKLKGKP